MARSDERATVWEVTVDARHNGVMVKLDALRQQLAAQGLHVVTDAEMADFKESLALWKHWTEHDITEDDDRWVAFTNKVHALLRRRERKQ